MSDRIAYMKHRLRRAQSIYEEDGFIPLAKRGIATIRDDLTTLRYMGKLESQEAHEVWKERMEPLGYLEQGSDETSEFIADTISEYEGGSASVLELGCNVGRHLNLLCERGFSELYGIDISEAALDTMADHYPDLSSVVTTVCSPLETELPKMEDNAFDAVYSVAVLMHIASDSEFVFEEIARVCSGTLITIEAEHPRKRRTENRVYRNYGRVFERVGFTQVRQFDYEDQPDVLGDNLDDRYVVRVFRSDNS